jgi:GxxExxY protein
MHENQISEKIIGCAIEVHRQLGPGLLESVYEEALCYELSQAGLRFQRQEEVSINYKGVVLRAPLRLDLIVEGKVIIDNKSKADLTPMDKQRLLTYLRLRGLRLGLLINFNVPRLVDGVHRVVDQLEDGSLRPSAPPRSPRFSS